MFLPSHRHGVRQDSAANDDGVARTLALEGLANLFANPSDISQIENAVRLAWYADANEGQFRLADCFAWIEGGAQPARLGSGCYDLADVCLNNGRLPAVDQIDFSRDRVDHDDPFDVALEGDTSFHVPTSLSFLCPILILPVGFHLGEVRLQSPQSAYTASWRSSFDPDWGRGDRASRHDK
jgi:hypothetical protein